MSKNDANPSAPVRAEQETHKHEFAQYEVCKVCGLTEAAIEGCHHCNDSESLKNGRCWWCLQALVPVPSPVRAEAATEPKPCPKCGGANSAEAGGNERCFHCGSCGFIECDVIDDAPGPVQEPEAPQTPEPIVLKLDSYYEWCIEQARDDWFGHPGSTVNILLAVIDSLLKQGRVEVAHDGYHKRAEDLRSARGPLASPVQETPTPDPNSSADAAFQRFGAHLDRLKEHSNGSTAYLVAFFDAIAKAVAVDRATLRAQVEQLERYTGLAQNVMEPTDFGLWISRDAVLRLLDK